MSYDSARRVTVLFGGFDGSFEGDTWEFGRVCTGGERIKKTVCKNRRGTNQLKVNLGNGVEGDGFIIALADGSMQSGTINSRGNGKVKFNNRPPSDGGTATATWGCGTVDEKGYSCL